MESLMYQIAGIAEQLLHFMWLPLLIWTILSCLIWLILRAIQKIHPQYQYHIRLALLFALPAGFLTLVTIQLTGFLFLQTPPDSYAIISVTAPFEITASPGNSSLIMTTSILYSLAFLLFISGVIITCISNLIQWYQLVHLKSECQFAPTDISDGFDKYNLGLIKQANKKIQIAFLDEDIIPVTFGIKRPVILLPSSLKYDLEKLNMVLRHELTHITQNDFLSNLIISLTQILFWFHPFVYFLKRELIDYREMRCDSMVLSHSSVSKKKYASLLLELLPLSNVNKELSVNMAQESSNLKKRIVMITQQKPNRPIPKRSSLAIFAFIILSTAIAMACTDMQTESAFDEENLNIMTDMDQTGDRGYHQIMIFLGDEEQADHYQEVLDRLNHLKPKYIQSFEVLKGVPATDEYGERASNGVIKIITKPDIDSYNLVLKALGMEPEEVPQLTLSFEKDNFFLVVDDMPELIGGLPALQEKIKYPHEAKQAGIEGRVFVQFIVNEQGDVEDAKIIRGIGGGADEEALRVVNETKFTPGYQNGKPVRVKYSLPIVFSLDKDDK